MILRTLDKKQGCVKIFRQKTIFFDKVALYLYDSLEMEAIIMRKTILILLLVAAVALVSAGGVAIWLWNDNVYSLPVTLEGDFDVYLEYGETFEDPGAFAVFYGTRWQKEPVSVPVSVSGKVDNDTLGSYVICYKAQYKDYIGTAYRRVRILDTTAPQITLVADPEKYTLPNTPYEEEGFTASDNHDGDLTDRVQRLEKDGVVTYTVRDSSGNETSVTRQIIYNDPEPPVLKLNGGSVVLLTGATYKEPGYTATDNCDGDITDKVTVSGGVDTFKPGQYTRTYTVRDTFGNEVSLTRTVIVRARTTDQVNDPTNGKDKIIYLTFDDGPGPETPRLLDVLKKYNVQATFFVVNTGYIKTIQRAANEGHVIAIHTATHKFKEIYASEKAYFDDLNKMRNIIVELTGQTPTLIRFPGGSSNTVSSFNPGIMTRLSAAVQEKGYFYFDWNVDSDDAGRARTAQRVYDNVITGVSKRKQSVVLMHDIKSYTIDAIEQIIIWGLENGYTFMPLTESSPGCHHTINN